MIEYLIILLAIPLGILARKLTKDEKDLYEKYFLIIIPVIFLSAVIFAFLDRQTFLTLVFIFLMLVSWDR